MPNQNYIAGRSFEYAIMGRLRKAGYWVLRSAGSKGPVDVAALRAGWRMLLIQCKRGKGIPAPDAWNKLYELARIHNAIPLLASRSSEKGARRVEYWELTGERGRYTRSEEVLRRFSPFGQEEMDI